MAPPARAGADDRPAVQALPPRWRRRKWSRTLGKLPNASEPEKAHLEELARRLVNKLLHAPLRTLKQSDGPHLGAGGAYVHAVERLFGLALPAGEGEGPVEAVEAVEEPIVELPPPPDEQS